MENGVRQGLIQEPNVSSCEDSEIDLLPSAKLFDLKYVDDIVLLHEDLGKLKALLDRLSDSLAMFGMCFAPSKCKMLLRIELIQLATSQKPLS
ncbi:unnamed protein product [Echinostoma caproni]|uniref:Reverse transcriptase domain-containing protein n=1 Tax=Echinostoma caproni TaxID=27848 RepID=A0A183B074_9TREM|nr:unnamed protein product [Echinostoma caproni]